MRRVSCLVAAIASCIPLVARAQASTSAAVHIGHIETDIRPAPLFHGSPPPTTLYARMRALRVPAVSIAVVDSGRIVWTKAYGVADADTGQPATSATRFQAGSMSKPVAAMATLRLVEEGKLSLDADVNGVLRSWKIPASNLGTTTAVTLRMLLGHTAGLTVHGFPGYAAGASLPTVPQILDGSPPANSPAVRVDVMPGTIWSYSGGGITVVQLLMTDVTGEEFPALVRRLVLSPVKMTSSGYEQPLPDSLIGLAASGHRADGKAVPGRWHTYPEMMAAGLWTTPTDLGRYIIELQHACAGTSSLIKQATARAMITPGLGGWGLGIQVMGSGDSLRFMHGGDNDGFHGEFIGYVSGGRGIVVMTNGDGGAALVGEIVAAIGREYNWPGLRALNEHVEIPLDATVLAGYVGKYQLTPNLVLTITQSGGQLSAQATGQIPFQLFPEGVGKFFAKIADVQIRFETDSTGKATAMRFVQSGTTLRAARIE